MSMQAAIAGLSGITLVLACGHRPPPAAVAELRRNPRCPDTLAHRDSGIGLANDVHRGPRYRIDSAGRVETLPPVPAAGSDTARPGCPAIPDTSGDSTPR